nr:unnamed protein product [Callosobruchus chinensis]
MTLCWKPVSTSPPNFLDITFETARHVKVYNGPYVGLVDAHTESNRSHDDPQLSRHESVLNGPPPASGQPCVVRLRLQIQPFAFLIGRRTALRNWLVLGRMYNRNLKNGTYPLKFTLLTSDNYYYVYTNYLILKIYLNSHLSGKEKSEPRRPVFSAILCSQPVSTAFKVLDGAPNGGRSQQTRSPNIHLVCKKQLQERFESLKVNTSQVVTNFTKFLAVRNHHITSVKDAGCCCGTGVVGTVLGDLGGEGLSKLMIEGLAGYPEEDTEEGPGVVAVLLFAAVAVEDEIPVESAHTVNQCQYPLRIDLSAANSPRWEPPSIYVRLLCFCGCDIDIYWKKKPLRENDKKSQESRNLDEKNCFDNRHNQLGGDQ